MHPITRLRILQVSVGLGLALLVGLMIWQTVRATGRAARIELAEARMTQPPAALPNRPNPDDHQLTPVLVIGQFDHSRAQVVLASTPRLGPGGRIITPFHVDGRRRPILVDRGFAPDTVLRNGVGTIAPVAGSVEVRGILLWPREVGPFTPERDAERELWFARDVDAMATMLETEPVLLVASDSGPDGWPLALPPAADQRNVHIEYAVTWGALAVAWLIIGGVLVRRERRRFHG